MKYPVFLLSVMFACVAPTTRAAWYWPFGNDEDSPDAKPRLHRLLENANDLIEQAEDAALDGDAEKALELYNSALTNLVDVAAKNPDRAEKPEFAPLRNKIAATSAAIDSIRFAQVNRNIRAVAVTDTTELQRKYDEEQARKKGLKKPEPKKPAAKTPEEKPAVREKESKAGLAGKVWQYFISVPDFKSVGVRDGKRYEGWPAIMRAVNTTDAMTATIEEIPYHILHKITARITTEVEGINRVVYDLTPKPVGTIEWE